MTFSKYWKTKPVTQQYCIQQVYHSDVKEKEKKDFPQQKLSEFNNIRPALQEILKKNFYQKQNSKNYTEVFKHYLLEYKG